MRNLKRMLAMALSLVMVLSIVGLDRVFVGASADSYDQALVNQFTDIKGHWASEGLTNLIGYGYMRGVGNYQAAPNDTLTTAQLVALLVRVMGGSQEDDLSGYVDMDPRAWYYSEMAQGLNMGIIPNTNTNYMNPHQAASREYAAYMLCRAFGLTVREPITDYADADKVSDWAVSSMQAMVAAKAIVGSSGSNGRYLNPQETITRGEFAQMIYRLNEDYIQASDSSNVSKQTFNNGLLISKAGVTLTDCTVKGNLYIADSVGNGDITLKNTKVEGNIYARGGGERSIHLDDGTTANSVVMINPHNPARLVVSDDSKINGVLVNNGVNKVTLEGPVGNVTINVSDVDLDLDGATATNVIVNSADSIVTVDKDSKIDTLSIASSSSGVKIDSKGVVQRLALMANDAELNLSGTLDYLLIGAVSGLKLDLDSSISLGALDLHCSDSTISVNSDVKSINVSAFSEKLKLELGKNAKVLALGISSPTTDLSVSADAEIGAITIDAPKYKGGISGLALNNLTIGAAATEAEITLDSKTSITNMFVNGDKVKINTVNGSVIKDLNVTGKEVTISGSGTVDRVNASITAEGLTVTTGNTAVANAGADKVTAGGVEVPPNKTYVTTSDGKDVIRNNDGTPDGDGDKTTGAGQEVNTVANFELAFAKDAAADDIHSSRNWALSNLVDSMSLVKNTDKGAAYKLTGNVKKVDQFTPVYDPVAGYGTGYYVPIVVSADFMKTENDWTCTVNGVTYTKNNLSTGSAYKDQLIVFLQLQKDNSRTGTVTLDRDGSGTKYSPVTVSVDYSGVSFDGVQDNTSDALSYPINATAADLTSDGALSLAKFGTLNMTKTGDTVYSATGSAYYVTDVKGNRATGGLTQVYHFLPVMVNTRDFANGWSVVLDEGTKFTAANVSTGTGCTGNLVMLLGLTENRSAWTIYVDSNGDGRSDTTYTVNIGAVTKLTEAQTPNVPNEPALTTRFAVPTNANSIDLGGQFTSISQLGTYGLTANYMSGGRYWCLTGGSVELATAPTGNVTSANGKNYFPLLVNTSDFSGNWSVSTNLGGYFGPSNVIPTGGNYAGNLLIYVALPEPNSYTQFCTVSVDKTGNGVADETWNLYSTVTLGTSTPAPTAGRLSVPTAAQATDLANTGLTSITELGTFGMTNHITYTELTGNATALTKAPTGNVTGAAGTYYYPLLISTSGLTGNWSVKASTGQTFTAANVIGVGGAYAGNLLVFVSLPQPQATGDTNAFLTLEIDKNGNGVADEVCQLVSTVVLGTGSQQPVTSNAIRLATNGNAIDFAGSGFSSIEDFGEFTWSQIDNSDQNWVNAIWQISGTANYIEEMDGNYAGLDAEWHHFVPLVIDVSGYTGDWEVNFIAGQKFHKEDVVGSGGNYAGQLVVFVDLYHAEDEAVDKYTALIFVDTNGDGTEDTYYKLYDNVTLTAQVIEDYGEIPDGVSFTTDRATKDIDIYDVNGVLFNDDGSVKTDEAVRVVKAYLLEEGYKNIRSTALGGRYIFEGTAGDITLTFYMDPETNVHKSFRVTVYYPGTNSSVSFLETGSVTVQDIIREFKEETLAQDTYVGNYYFLGEVGGEALLVSTAAQDTLTDDATLYLGYYKVTAPATMTATANGMVMTPRMTIPLDYTPGTFEEGQDRVYYVAYGEEITVECVLTGDTNASGGTITLAGTGVNWNMVTQGANPDGVSWTMGSGSITFRTAIGQNQDEEGQAVNVPYTLDKTYLVKHAVTGNVTYSVDTHEEAVVIQPDVEGPEEGGND